MKNNIAANADFHDWIRRNPACQQTLERIQLFIYCKWTIAVRDHFGSDPEKFYDRLRYLQI